MARDDIKSLLILGLCVFGLISLFILTSGLPLAIVITSLSVLLVGIAIMFIAYRVFRSKLL